MSDSVRPHRRQPTRLHHPRDSPGKKAGVGCHFLLQCMKVKSESGFAQSCPTLHDPMDCSPPDSSVHGLFQARVLEWVAIAFSKLRPSISKLVSELGWKPVFQCPEFLSIYYIIFSLVKIVLLLQYIQSLGSLKELIFFFPKLSQLDDMRNYILINKMCYYLGGIIGNLFLFRNVQRSWVFLLPTHLRTTWNLI